MKRTLTSLLLVLALPLAAQDAPKADPPVRFAFFTLGLLVDKSTKAKKVFSELEAVKKRLNDKLQEKAKEGQNLQQQLQSSSLSSDGRETITKKLRDLEFEYKKLQDDSQSEFEKVQQRVLGEIYQMAGPIIDGLAKEQKLQVVFSGESAQAGQLVHWADETWIQAFTAEVAKRLDASNVTPGAAKPATAPKPATPAKPAIPGTKPTGGVIPPVQTP